MSRMTVNYIYGQISPDSSDIDYQPAAPPFDE